MPEDVNLTALIGREPEEIIAYFERKGYEISFRWQDVWQDAHKRAFTVAGVTKAEVLQSIRQSVADSLAEGKTFREFKKDLEPKLRELGWWGEREIVDTETGEVRTVELGTPHRMRTIYRTNLQTTYMAGRHRSQEANIDRRPYWRYVAVLDSNTRPSHAERHGVVLRADDDWWDTNYPPNGWGCRCRVQSLSERQVQRRGLDVATGAEIGQVASEEWAYNPADVDFDPDVTQYASNLARDLQQELNSYDPPDAP